MVAKLDCGRRWSLDPMFVTVGIGCCLDLNMVANPDCGRRWSLDLMFRWYWMLFGSDVCSHCCQMPFVAHGC